MPSINEVYRACQEGRLGDAETLIATALAAGTTNPDLLNLHGELLVHRGRHEEAAAKFNEAVELRLNFPDAQRNLSSVLAALHDPRPRFSVTVITPTVGTPFLAQAIASVQAQTYPFVEHVVVADGPRYYERVRAMLPAHTTHPVSVFELPHNTGGGGFNGHRIYGAMPHLVNGRFVAFLDEDNWYEPEHIATLMEQITTRGLSWAYALRRIVGLDDRALANDDCESLGQWPTWNDPHVHLVDVNCYVLRRDLAIRTGSLWYRRYPDETCPDFALCQQLLQEHPQCGTNGLYTVNYRVGRSTCSVQPDFFLAGNEVMRQRFPAGFPWRASSRR